MKIWCTDILDIVSPCAATVGKRSEMMKGATLRLSGASNETIVFQLVVEALPSRIGNIQVIGLDGYGVELFQNVAICVNDEWYDDVLVPVDPKNVSAAIAQIADTAVPVPERVRQAFTIQMQVPKATQTGWVPFRLEVTVDGAVESLSGELQVFGFELPDKPTCVADLNSYGKSVGSGYDGVESFDEYLKVEQAYFLEARKHNAILHALPYSHSGGMEKDCAPVLEGRGKNRRVADWAPFDNHYGPYLDGSVFSSLAGKDFPVEYLYAPFNLNWPAYFENFGKPGYEVEFRNVLREFMEHFREKGWTETKFEIFFNHKARYKFFPWDMDEIRFERDNYATEYFARIVNEEAAAYPELKVINRIDSSWIFGETARGSIGDVVQLWVANRAYHSISPDASRILRDEKGQEIWIYGGAAPVDVENRKIPYLWPWNVWGRDLDGFCWWNAVGWGSWEKPGSGGDYCFYPGERFGLRAPLASMRLKSMMQGMQTHAYLTLLDQGTGSREQSEAVVRETIGCDGRRDWYEWNDVEGLSGSQIIGISRSQKPWNLAPMSAYSEARRKLAQAIEAL